MVRQEQRTLLSCVLLSVFFLRFCFVVVVLFFLGMFFVLYVFQIWVFSGFLSFLAEAEHAGVSKGFCLCREVLFSICFCGSQYFLWCSMFSRVFPLVLLLGGGVSRFFFLGFTVGRWCF